MGMKQAQDGHRLFYVARVVVVQSQKFLFLVAAVELRNWDLQVF